jgi:hypothetical protein
MSYEVFTPYTVHRDAADSVAQWKGATLHMRCAVLYNPDLVTVWYEADVLG